MLMSLTAFLFNHLLLLIFQPQSNGNCRRAGDADFNRTARRLCRRKTLPLCQCGLRNYHQRCAVTKTATCRGSKHHEQAVQLFRAKTAAESTPRILHLQNLQHAHHEKDGAGLVPVSDHLPSRSRVYQVQGQLSRWHRATFRNTCRGWSPPKHAERRGGCEDEDELSGVDQREKADWKDDRSAAVAWWFGSTRQHRSISRRSH